MEEIHNFINNSTLKDLVSKYADLQLNELVLKLHKFSVSEREFVISQVNALQKIKHKIPQWAGVEGLVFPTKVSFEQCSSSETGHYKANILSGLDSVADFTGGFGVDTYYLAKNAKKVTYFERNASLCEIVKHNFQCLGLANVSIYNEDSATWIANNAENVNFDMAYLDPARRGAANTKLFKLEDCEPNVLELMPQLTKMASKILIKLSPMVDLSMLVKAIPMVSQVHVVSVKNDCKEILVLIDTTKSDASLVIKTVDFKSNDNVQFFEFVWGVNGLPAVKYSEPLKYIYEPNTSVMKSQGFVALANSFGMSKLAPNSHLFTSDSLILGFPGRRFEVLKECNYTLIEVHQNIVGGKANVSVRNFPESVDQVKTKLKIKDGGDIYLLATSSILKKRLILVCMQI